MKLFKCKAQFLPLHLLNKSTLASPCDIHNLPLLVFTAFTCLVNSPPRVFSFPVSSRLVGIPAAARSFSRPVRASRSSVSAAPDAPVSWCTPAPGPDPPYATASTSGAYHTCHWPRPKYSHKHTVYSWCTPALGPDPPCATASTSDAYHTCHWPRPKYSHKHTVYSTPAPGPDPPYATASTSGAIIHVIGPDLNIHINILYTVPLLQTPTLRVQLLQPLMLIIHVIGPDLNIHINILYTVPLLQALTLRTRLLQPLVLSYMSLAPT